MSLDSIHYTQNKHTGCECHSDHRTLSQGFQKFWRHWITMVLFFFSSVLIYRTLRVDCASKKAFYFLICNWVFLAGRCVTTFTKLWGIFFFFAKCNFPFKLNSIFIVRINLSCYIFMKALLWLFYIHFIINHLACRCLDFFFL